MYLLRIKGGLYYQGGREGDRKGRKKGGRKRTTEDEKGKI